MKKIHRIILTTDFSEGARKAYPFAAHLAERFGAKIFLVHFKNKKAPEHSGVTNDDHLREILQRLKQESEREEFAQAPVVVKRLDRNITKSLPLYVAEIKAGLVLTAIRRRKGIEHFILSDIGEEVLARSTVPVFVYASPENSTTIPETKRVLVPVTGAAGMTDVLPTAVFFAKNFDCKILFLLVTPQSNERENWFLKWFKSGNDTRKSAHSAFDQFKQSELSDIDAELAFVSGVPAKMIAEFAIANDIDLAVIGLRGFEKGICKRVIYQANCSVLKLVTEKIHED